MEANSSFSCDARQFVSVRMKVKRDFAVFAFFSTAHFFISVSTVAFASR